MLTIMLTYQTVAAGVAAAAAIVVTGLGHVMRLTNLMRKAHCIIAKERRDNGKRVNLSEHLAAARNANIPFLLIDRLEPQLLVALLRPLLLRKRIVVEHPQSAQVHGASAVFTDVELTKECAENS